MTETTGAGTETLRQLGMLAKQRREEIGLNRDAFRRQAGIESELAIKDFEYGRSLPTEDMQLKLENALGWKLGVIAVVVANSKTEALTMEELDAEDSLYLAGQVGAPSLASASDAELLAEVARRGL
jgi:transcriptional regulator with XRE-family HTH domain